MARQKNYRDGAGLETLEAERKRLVANLAHQAALLSQNQTHAGEDVADDAFSLSEQQTTLALRRLLEERLHKVERAIARARRGARERCERCGQAIAKERLQALPSATMCIQCARLPA